jgi:hypothetical protein
METVKEVVKVEVSVEVHPDWIEFCTQANDLFMTSYCGYWMYGMAHDEKLGWLCYVHSDEKTIDQVEETLEYEDAVSLWEEGKTLPKDWYALNKEAAIKAFGEGVKRSGVKWYENGDANDYDVAIQKALLGEVRYG